MDVLEMRRRISEAEIAALVELFYERVRDDSLLGPVFAAQVEDDAWPGHLATMRDFWSTALIGTATYRRDPMVAHRGIAGLGCHHFERWLSLFERVAHDTFPDDIADAIVQRACRMGDRLTKSLGL